MAPVPTHDPAGATNGSPLNEASQAGIAAMVPGVTDRAAEMGLLGAEIRQVGVRLPVKLPEQARRRTGIGSTTDLLALANVAVEDDFAKVFAEARDTLDPDLDIGF